MRIVKEHIVLRRRRSEGERMPHRFKLDAVREGDSLLVEIVVGKDENLIYRYLFRPAQLFGRRGISFRESGNEIYWLSGLKPKILLQQQAEALLAQSDIRKEKAGKHSDAGHARAGYPVLVFGMYDSLVSVHRTLNDVAAAMNLRAEAIDKLCRTKRASTETGYSFRYRKRKLDLDITDFTLTLSRYDGLCKRKPGNKE